MNTTPDYTALVKLFPVLRNLVDARGEVILTAAEAAQIRLLGFRANEGRWRVPPVPPELVADNPLLENLSIGWNSRKNLGQPIRTNGSMQDPKAAVPQASARSSDFQPEPMVSRQAPEQEGLTELSQKILRVVENAGGRILKRQLQKKFWRFRAKAFRTAVSELIHCGSLRLDGKWVVVVPQKFVRPDYSRIFGTPHPETTQESEFREAIGHSEPPEFHM